MNANWTDEPECGSASHFRDLCGSASHFRDLSDLSRQVWLLLEIIVYVYLVDRVDITTAVDHCMRHFITSSHRLGIVVQ